MENLAVVGNFLGGLKVFGEMPQNESELITMIQKGFPQQVFTAVQKKTKFSDDTICVSLKIAKRTPQRRKKQGNRLKPNESELLLRLARIFVAAAETFGDEEKAREWLQRENRALGGRVPIKLLDTGVGFQEVKDLLTRIDHGVYS